jgi:hypothetical protein
MRRSGDSRCSGTKQTASVNVSIFSRRRVYDKVFSDSMKNYEEL